ncbi:MAG: hypothetical protein Q8S13_12345 [Dehalococcoidia bacterium]|nr:hypothetical protein [Dehalococcoidia bacterium]
MADRVRDCILRTRIGTATNGEPVIAEVWVTHEPTAAHLRKLAAIVEMMAGWHAEDEARIASKPAPAPPAPVGGATEET